MRSGEGKRSIAQEPSGRSLLDVSCGRATCRFGATSSGRMTTSPVSSRHAPRSPAADGSLSTVAADVGSTDRPFPRTPGSAYIPALVQPNGSGWPGSRHCGVEHSVGTKPLLHDYPPTRACSALSRRARRRRGVTPDKGAPLFPNVATGELI
jgi:hypothetical protein